MKKTKLKTHSILKLDMHDSATSSDNMLTIAQEHARPRVRIPLEPILVSPPSLTSDISTSVSNTSLTSSISRFRNDFDELKCKMRIFGESLNLCKCIASDFRAKLLFMEQRLENLERRQRMWRSESNYSAIIHKNKLLSSKTFGAAKYFVKIVSEDNPPKFTNDVKPCKN